MERGSRLSTGVSAFGEVRRHSGVMVRVVRKAEARRFIGWSYHARLFESLMDCITDFIDRKGILLSLGHALTNVVKGHPFSINYDMYNFGEEMEWSPLLHADWTRKVPSEKFGDGTIPFRGFKSK